MANAALLDRIEWVTGHDFPVEYDPADVESLNEGSELAVIVRCDIRELQKPRNFFNRSTHQFESGYTVSVGLLCATGPSWESDSQQRRVVEMTYRMHADEVHDLPEIESFVRSDLRHFFTESQSSPTLFFDLEGIED